MVILKLTLFRYQFSIAAGTGVTSEGLSTLGGFVVGGLAGGAMSVAADESVRELIAERQPDSTCI